MEGVARLSFEDRKDLFAAAAEKLAIKPTVVEKDFWVSWVLKRLFEDPELKNQLVFKGGTSLSKVYGLIERFSEDVDLILDWRLLGYGEGKKDPYQEFISNTKRNKFFEHMEEQAGIYIKRNLHPKVTGLLGGVAGIMVSLDEKSDMNILVGYQAAFPSGYLKDSVKLEIGPRADWFPVETASISPLAVKAFPEPFTVLQAFVSVAAVERTFWEKATILHAVAHEKTDLPKDYARHYYDLYCLGESKHKPTFLRDTKMLAKVVRFKESFFKKKSAAYDRAKPGSFRILPDEDKLGQVKADYSNMEEMFYGDYPAFNELVDGLRLLETEINGMDG